MLDEEMDHIIRDAVDKHHPAYDDKAWEKMEKQLNKHLPQKKDRRKYLLFLLLFLLLGGAAFFGITYFNAGQKSNGRAIAENKKTEQLRNGNKQDQQLNGQPVTPNTVTADNTDNNLPDKATEPSSGENKNYPVENAVSAVKDTPKSPDKNNVGTPPMVNSNSGTGTKNDRALNTGKNKRAAVVKKGKSNMRVMSSGTDEELAKNEKQEGKNYVPLNGKTANKMNVTVTAAATENNENGNNETAQAELAKEKEKLNEQKKDPVKANEDKKDKEVAKTENKTSLSPDKKKSKKNIPGNFGITFSTGTDLSFIKLNKLGKATLLYGAGLSYTFRKRVTVRAGFYASKKIYVASPDQYYIPPGSNYPGLYEVDAVCKVYEIPVSLSYNFWQRKNHNWFGNAGLSSFLMKNEKYDYLYKNAGQTYDYKTEINNQNKHYFTVLTLSAGYQYRFNKWFSLQAEPYVKLPLAGVGQGKIKLNSSGVLFTVTVNPFAKRK